MNDNILAKIIWTKTKLQKDRIVSFCFNGICMPGRIEKSEYAAEDNELEIEISFIEPKHFASYIKKGYHFTIQEGSSIIIGVGFVEDFNQEFWDIFSKVKPIGG